MNLIIHDLDKKEWAKIKRDYAGWEVVSDRGTIRPCVGCFRCWYKTPGQCVIEDGYENMGVLIHRAEDVVVISRYTYGGFSGFVKNVFDRSLGYILPQFEVVNNETHHKKRYAEDKPFTFIFYGNISFSEEEKECARRYVTAVCANIRGHVKEVVFREGEGAAPENTGNAEVGSGQISGDNPRDSSGGDPASGKTVLLNGSMRSEKGNSAIFAQQLAALLQNGQKQNVPNGSGTLAAPEIVALKPYLDHLPDLLPILDEAEKIVLCLPLYVDGLPAQRSGSWNGSALLTAENRKRSICWPTWACTKAASWSTCSAPSGSGAPSWTSNTAAGWGSARANCSVSWRDSGLSAPGLPRKLPPACGSLRKRPDAAAEWKISLRNRTISRVFFIS